MIDEHPPSIALIRNEIWKLINKVDEMNILISEMAEDLKKLTEPKKTIPAHWHKSPLCSRMSHWHEAESECSLGCEDDCTEACVTPLQNLSLEEPNECDFCYGEDCQDGCVNSNLDV